MITMWDSAKKPIKIKSVIQSDGTRRFLLHDNINETGSPAAASKHAPTTHHDTKKVIVKIANFQREDEEGGVRIDPLQYLSSLTSHSNKKVRVSSDLKSLTQQQQQHMDSGGKEGEAGNVVASDFLEVNGNRVWRQSRRLFKSFDLRLGNERDFDLPLIHSCTETHSSIYELFTLSRFSMAKREDEHHQFNDGFFTDVNSNNSNSNSNSNSNATPASETILPMNWKQTSSWTKGNIFGNGTRDLKRSLVYGYGGARLGPNHRKTRSLSPELMSVSASNLREKECNSLCMRIMTWIDKEVKKNKGSLPSGVKASDMRIPNGLSLSSPAESPLSASYSNSNSDNSSVVEIEINHTGAGSGSGDESSCPLKKFPSFIKKSNMSSSGGGGRGGGGGANSFYGGGFGRGLEEKLKSNNKKSVTIVEDLNHIRQKKNRKKRQVAAETAATTAEDGGDIKTSDNGQIWGEVKLDDCVVYLMGETKARSICNIEVPENKDKIQLHIFLPVIDNNGFTTGDVDNRSDSAGSSKK